MTKFGNYINPKRNILNGLIFGLYNMYGNYSYIEIFLRFELVVTVYKKLQNTTKSFFMHYIIDFSIKINNRQEQNTCER